LTERGTPEFYREQAARLTKLATEAKSVAARLELLDIAAVFQKLAQHSVANRDPRDSGTIDAGST
jgi:hypothetical protein